VRGGFGAAALLAMLLTLAWAAPGRADESGSLEETLGGFDDEGDPESEPEEGADPGDDYGFDDDDADEIDSALGVSDPTATDAPPFWHLGGDLSLGSSYNYLEHHSATGTPYGNLSRLRAQLDLQLDLRLPADWKARVEGYGFYDFVYVLKGRNDYTNDVLDDYEWEVDFREVWVQGSPAPSFDVKLGRQIVNWGRSDTVRVVDILNPLDNREPGLVDIEDLRLPLTMARFDWYPRFLPATAGDWSLQLLVIPEFRQDRNPSIGNDFNPIDPGALPIPLPEPDTPHQFGSSPEYGASLGGVFSGWDVSLYAARVYQNTSFVTGGRKGDSHITMTGAGGNVTFGSWLLKTELAYLYGVEYSIRTPAPPFLLAKDKSRLDAMGGVEYYGLDDVQIAFEVVNRHIFQYQSGQKPFQEQDTLESALRITLDFLNDRLHATAVGFALGSHAQDGSVVRVEASYDLRDALTLGGGIVLYQKGDSPTFEEIGRNDRLFLRLEYSF
jgi:hypothetical protein